MDNNDIYNWNSQNLEVRSISEGLVFISETIYKISDELIKISEELAMQRSQNESNINDTENLQKQINFLTNEIKEIKKNTR